MPGTLALPPERRSGCRSPGPAEPSGPRRAPHPPAADAAPACARARPATGDRGAGSRRAWYLSLLSRGSEFATSGSPPRPPPPPLLFSRLASFSSRRRDRRGPSQPLRPVWGPAPPSVPGPPLPICSGPAPSPPRGGDAPSSSPDPPAVGGEAGGCVGREPQGPTLRRDPGPALPTWVPRPPPQAGRRTSPPVPKRKAGSPALRTLCLGVTRSRSCLPGDEQSKDAGLSLSAELETLLLKGMGASLSSRSCLHSGRPSTGSQLWSEGSSPRGHLQPHFLCNTTAAPSHHHPLPYLLALISNLQLQGERGHSNRWSLSLHSHDIEQRWHLLEISFTGTYCLVLNLIKPEATVSMRVIFFLKKNQRFGGYLFILFLFEILLPSSLSLFYFKRG